MESLFAEFLQFVKSEESTIIETIDNLLISKGCKRTIKESASGYTVFFG